MSDVVKTRAFFLLYGPIHTLPAPLLMAVFLSDRAETKGRRLDGPLRALASNDQYGLPIKAGPK